MKKFKVAIVDDEKEARELLKKFLSKYEFLDVFMTSGDVEEAILTIMKTPPDLLFLDIHMPHKDGFELVKDLERMKIHSKVIFVTAYNSYAIKAIKVNAFDYLLKPIDPDELEEALIRYRQSVLESEHFKDLKDTLESFQIPRRVKFTTDKGFVIINTRDIVYIQYDKVKVHFFLSNGTREIIKTSISEVRDKLPRNVFIEVDSSTLLNNGYLTRVNVADLQCELTFQESKIRLPVTQQKIKGLQDFLNSQHL